MFDPASIMVEQRARRAKTERIDGEKLLGTLMAYWRGEPRVVRIARVPSAEQEDARRDSREEERLTREQVGHINRIKALLRLLGMPVGNPRRRDWLGWLAKQRDWQGQGVPPRLLAEIEREHGRLMLVVEQLAKLKKPSAPEPLTPAAAEMARRKDMLLRVKSLGPAFSSRLINEVFYSYCVTIGSALNIFGSWQSSMDISVDAQREQRSAVGAWSRLSLGCGVRAVMADPLGLSPRGTAGCANNAVERGPEGGIVSLSEIRNP